MWTLQAAADFMGWEIFNCNNRWAYFNGSNNLEKFMTLRYLISSKLSESETAQEKKYH